MTCHLEIARAEPALLGDSLWVLILERGRPGIPRTTGLF